MNSEFDGNKNNAITIQALRYWIRVKVIISNCTIENHLNGIGISISKFVHCKINNSYLINNEQDIRLFSDLDEITHECELTDLKFIHNLYSLNYRIIFTGRGRIFGKIQRISGINLKSPFLLVKWPEVYSKFSFNDNVFKNWESSQSFIQFHGKGLFD